MQNTPPQMRSHESAPVSFSAGALLLGASLLEILAMAHHPSVNASDTGQALQQLARFSHLSQVVHGSLMTLMLVIAYGYSEFVLRRGPRRPLVRAGAIAYGSGVILMLGAALISGFIIADLSSTAPRLGTPDADVNLQFAAQIFRLCAVQNQAYAGFGVIAMSVGILCWSLDLAGDCDPWRSGVRGGRARRLVGALGLAVAAAPVLALMAGKLHLDVHGMTRVTDLQAFWNAAVATLMMRSLI